MGISITHRGEYSKITMYLKNLLRKDYTSIVRKYADQGLEALREYTPKDTGLTANSWSYEIEQTRTSIKVTYLNSNVNKHINIALIIQYGHGTGTGGWVEGIDYINPALKPVFEQMAAECWREVKR